MYRVSSITAFEMGNLNTSKRLTVGLWLGGLLLCWLWLTSFDRYLTARYHWSLESELASALPSGWAPSLMHASQRMRDWTSAIRDEEEGERVKGRSGMPKPHSGMDAKASTTWRPPAPPEALPLQAAVGPGWPSLRQQWLNPGPQRILFAGDSMMQGVAPLVSRELAKRYPDWSMLDLSRQSTGLTVRRYFDWPTRIVQEMDAQQLSLVVIFLGPNDPWDLVVDGRRLVFPSPQWAQQYALRVDEILSAARERDVKVIWLGLPAMREGRVHQGAVVQNQIFHSRAKAWGTDYLATEPLIGALSEPFQKFLPDASGQPVNLRSGDGIHFTAAGLHRIKQAVLDHIEGGLRP